MADARYVIDIILKARDDTAAAFASAIGQQKAFEALTRQSRQENEKYAQSFDRINEKVRASQAELDRQKKALGNLSDEAIDAQVKLERAAKAYVSAQGDAKKTDAERAQSLKQLMAAEDEFTKATDRNTARRITNANLEIARAEQLRKVYADGAREQARLDDERARKHAELMKILDEADADHDRRAKARREAEAADIEAKEADRKQRHADLMGALDEAEADQDRRAKARRETTAREIEQLERDRAARTRDTLRQIDETERDIARRRDQEARNRDRDLQAPRQYLNTLRQIQQLESERSRAVQAGDVARVAEVDLDTGKARAQAEELAAQLRVLLGHVESKVDFNDAEAAAHAVELHEVLKKILGNDIHFDVQADLSALDVAKVEAFKHSLADNDEEVRNSTSGLGLFTGAMQAFMGGFDQSSGRIASFDNFLRGLMSLGIAGFFQQLFLLAGAAAGALAALASSALYAGGALGGGLVAGIAQALPVIGILGAAIYRLKAVFDAAQQSQLLEQQQSYLGAKQHKKAADTADAVRSAQDRLAEAHRRVSEAQDNLTDARQRAIDKLEDLILAERGASLSVEESRKAIARAAAQGDTGALDRAFLQRDESALQLQRTRGELQTRQAGGIEKSPEVSQAQQQLNAAKQSIEPAERALDKARRGADLASANITAAAGKLNFLLGRMSGAERRLYETVKNLQDVFRNVAETITAPIINATDKAFKRIIGILQNPAVINAARGLATQMAAVGTRIFNAFTSPQMLGQFMRIMDQAGKNLKPLADIVVNFGKAFMDLGEAASPALHEIMVWFGSISKSIADFMRQGRQSGALSSFFKEGVVHLKAWGGLLWEIIRLFAAIAGPGGGAASGLKMVNSMASAIGKWADAIATPGTKINKFFKEFFSLSSQMLSAMGPVFKSIGHQFELTFNKQGVGAVKGFATFLADVLIPALGKFARFVGQGTAAIGAFARQHPAITKLASAFIAAMLAFSVVGRVMTIFGPFTGLLKFIATTAFEAAGGVEALGGAMGILGLAMEALPFIAIAAAIVFVLAKLGLLDDVVRGVKAAFNAFMSQIGPPFERLKKSVQDFIKAFEQGKGLFAIVRPIVKAFIDMTMWALKLVGSGLGKFFGGLIDVLSGVLDILTGIMTGDFGKIWDGLKRATVGIGRAIIGIFEAAFGALLILLPIRGLAVGKGIVMGLLRGLGTLGKLIVAAFVEGINLLLGWLGIKSPSTRFITIGKQIVMGLIHGLEGVGKSILNVFSDAIHGISSGLKSIGKRIITAIVDGIKAAPEILKNAISDLLDKVPGGGAVKKVLSKLPFAHGGPVPGTGDFDTVNALLTPGEHVWTKREVQNAGGHGVLRALRALFGGGGKTRGGPTGYMLGDAVVPVQRSSINVNTDADTDGQARRWRLMWAEITASTRRNAQFVESRIRDMRVATTATWRKMFEDARDLIVATEMSAKVHFTRLGNSITESMNNVQNAVYRGMRYISSSTNDAMKAFGGDAIKVSIAAPKDTGRASGGWVGNQGERGKDAVPTWLGRGEAVLNFAHQKLVDPALRAVYGFGLPEMFSKVKGFHAGGQDTAPGFAQGGFTGPFGSGAAFTAIANFAKRKFNLTMTAGRSNHSTNTAYGNVSDHSWGGAGDFSNGYNTPQESAFNQFWLKKAPQVIKQLIWQGKDQQRGFPIYDHFDHVHLAVQKALAFDLPRMAKIISRASRGLSLDALLANISSEDGTGADHIDRLKVKGHGPLRSLVQRMMNKLVGQANTAIDGEYAKDVGGGTGPHDNVPHFAGPWVDDMRRIAQKFHWNLSDWTWLVNSESGGDPTAVNKSSGAFGLGQFLGGTLREYASLGATSKNPSRQIEAMAAYIRDRYHDPTRAKAFHLANNWYAGGGIVGGAKGAAVPIVAHAGEWVLNKIQQSRLANLLGMGVGKLRDALGFSGGPTHFAGGGEVDTTGTVNPFVFSPERMRETERHEKLLGDLQERRQKAEESHDKKRIKLIEDAISAEGKLHEKRIGSMVAASAGQRAQYEAARPSQQRAIARSLGVYQTPDVLPTNLPGIDREVNRVFSAMKHLKGVTKFPVALAQWTKNLGALTDDGGLLDQMGDAITALQSRTETSLNLAKVGYQKVKGKLKKIVPLTDPVEIADRTVDSLTLINKQLMVERKTASRGLEKTNNRIKELQKGGISAGEKDEYTRLMASRKKFTDTIGKIDSDFAKNEADKWNARVEAFEARTSAALKPSDDNAKWADFGNRIGQALGRTDIVQAAGKANLDSLQDRRKVLGDRLARAQELAKTDPRWQAEVDKLADDWRDTSAKIVETQAQNLANAIDTMEKSFSRESAKLDIQGRGADLRERMGDRLGAVQARQGVGQARGDMMNRQLDSYQQLYNQAAQEGNVGAMNDLSDKMDDLRMQIKENDQSVRELNFTYRQVATDIITGRQARSQGLYGAAGNILQKQGELEGKDFVDDLRDTLERGGRNLREEGRNLASDVGDAIRDTFGSGTEAGGVLAKLRDAFSQGPEQYAHQLSDLAPEIAKLESTMGDTEKTAFSGLIDAMTDNTVAVIDNSQNIKNLQNPQAQTWSSTAWQWYREAIFSGMGDVLPQYKVPGMATGGQVTKDGLFKLHAGEFVVNAEGSNVPEGDINITVHEAGGPLDVTHLASRIAFEKKNRR
jgi:archaellum component FlaC